MGILEFERWYSSRKIYTEADTYPTRASFPGDHISGARPNPVPGDAASAAVVFDEVCRVNYWGSGESVSGVGSKPAFNRSYRDGPVRYFTSCDIRSIFDAPFGDRNWMAIFRLENSFAYIKVDISSEFLIRSLFAFPHLDLRVFDIKSDPFPETDLWHCRDGFLHSPLDEIRRALTSFVDSIVKHTAITSHLAQFLHSSIDMGFTGGRFNRLVRPSFNLPTPLARIPAYRYGHDFPDYVCFLSRGKIAEGIARW